MRNLAIAHQRDKERYRFVRGGGWDRPKLTFKPRDFVLMKQVQEDTLDVPPRPHILRVVEIKPSRVAVLEGSDAARVEEQVKNIAHGQLPIMDHNTYPERFYGGSTLHCRVCGLRSRGSKMVLCDMCYHGYHIWCLDKQLFKVLEGKWICPAHGGK